MKARDFRAHARAALSGNWGMALLTGLVAALLGGTAASTGFSSSGSVSSTAAEAVQNSDFSYMLDYDFASGFMAVMATLGIFFSIYGIVLFIIGGTVELGYNQYNINLLRRDRPAKISDLFSHFNILGKGLVTRLVINIFISLWLILPTIAGFILVIVAAMSSGLGYGFEYAPAAAIVGVIMLCILWVAAIVLVATVVSLRYAMAFYILSQNTQMDAMQAIRASKEMMKGNKWRLFCLQISFIGWEFLSALTLGIGSLWLRPYQSAAYAAFYLDLASRQPAPQAVPGAYPPPPYPPQNGMDPNGPYSAQGAYNPQQPYAPQPQQQQPYAPQQAPAPQPFAAAPPPPAPPYYNTQPQAAPPPAPAQPGPFDGEAPAAPPPPTLDPPAGPTAEQ